MKPRQLLTAMVGLLFAGCSYWPYIMNNIAETPTEVIDRCALRVRLRQMANAAWAKACQGQNYSVYYERGFKAGFVEFLDADGTGSPPAAPPWWYRTNKFLTPPGQLDVEDWFTGFRHGAQAARESGYRNVVVVPLALPPLHAPEPQTLPGQAVPVTTTPADVLTLPPPRVIPAERPKGKDDAELVPPPTPRPPGKKDGGPKLP